MAVEKRMTPIIVKVRRWPMSFRLR